MDAAARAVNNGRQPDSATPLRLRRESVSDPVDAVLEMFLGAEGAEAREPGAHAGACGDEAGAACGAESTHKTLHLRCPAAPSVRFGVEPSGRVCLEVEVGAGVSVGKVLGELEEAERWLRDSAHTAAMAPVAGRLDMSCPVRRRAIVGEGTIPVGTLLRAGLEVRNSGGAR